MFRSPEDYHMALTRIETDKVAADRQRQQFVAMGFTEAQIEEAMQPLLSFHAQLIDEVKWHRQIMAGDFSSLEDFDAFGRLLIAIRVTQGITQQELAERLSVPVEQVLQDERDEYYGFTKEELQVVLDALNRRVTTKVEEGRRELAYAE